MPAPVVRAKARLVGVLVTQLRAAVAAVAAYREAVADFFGQLPAAEWARAYYDRYRQRGHGHHAALRALGAKWLKIIFVLWSRQVPDREETHLVTMARQHLRQAA